MTNAAQVAIAILADRAASVALMAPVVLAGKSLVAIMILVVVAVKVAPVVTVQVFVRVLVLVSTVTEKVSIAQAVLITLVVSEETGNWPSETGKKYQGWLNQKTALLCVAAAPH